MIAGAEDFRDRPSTELGGPGVLRLFEEAVAEALRLNRRRVPDDTVEEACHAFDDGESGDLAAEQHIVAYRYLLIDEVLCNPFVDALIPTTNHRDLVECGETIQRRLIQWIAARCEQYSMCVCQWVERRGKRFGHHHHPGATAERSVIDLSVDSLAVLPQIVEHDVERAVLPGLAHEACVEGRCEELREDRDDIDPHGDDATCGGRSPETQRSIRRSHGHAVWGPADSSRPVRPPSSRPG